jgi:APA family basic amino acid/polyamine antiporter
MHTSPASSIPAPTTPEPSAGLARRLGAFDATMIVMGGIVGAGIFMNPSVVARQVHTPALILGAWAVGGAIALIGAFVYAELAVLRPSVGGQYAYLRDAYHPLVAFLYGWTLLLVVQTGGMAAVAMTFGNYFRELSGVSVPTSVLAVITLAVLTVINCLGVRAGSNVQSALMVMKALAIIALVTVGWIAVGSPGAVNVTAPAATRSPLAAFGAAMVPVMFAYGGWQTASFVSGELRDPRRDLARGMLAGVIGVVVLYLAVNLVCLRALGPAGLAATSTPASDVMRLALGPRGAQLIAAGIAISTVGFLSQGMLTAPRVYYAMARDGLFFARVGWLDPRTQAPSVAIVLQGVWAVVIVLSGRYEQILNYVVAIDALFFGLTGAALIVFRRRARVATGRAVEERSTFRTPGHPWTTLVFVATISVIAVSTVAQFPTSAGIGVLILLAGVPVYGYWRRRRAVRPEAHL